ncbi:MAG: TRAM domain-containing protein [Candidatus Aenigmatarchaeota archaeon]
MAKVKEGEIYDLEIEDISKRGDGVAKIDGYVIFVKNAQKGEKLKVKIVKAARNYAIGIAIR